MSFDTNVKTLVHASLMTTTHTKYYIYQYIFASFHFQLKYFCIYLCIYNYTSLQNKGITTFCNLYNPLSYDECQSGIACVTYKYPALISNKFNVDKHQQIVLINCNHIHNLRSVVNRFFTASVSVLLCALHISFCYWLLFHQKSIYSIVKLYLI